LRFFVSEIKTENSSQHTVSTLPAIRRDMRANQ
jgi:hypothetical protein